MPETSSKVRALVTGGSGFVGKHLVRTLLAQGWQVRCSTRRPWDNSPPGVERSVALDVGPTTDWKSLLDRVDVVFHLANRAHILSEPAQNPTAEFERVNAEGTAQLARSARAAGVRRVVYVSSIGVHGDSSEGAALTETSPLRPHNAYALSKVHGEAALQSEAGYGLEFVIVRPPLIYGEGVPGNFRRLMRLVASGIPLPLANVRNQRSFAAVGNVVDVLLLCGRASDAAGEAYVVADGDDLSTPDLVRTLADGLGTSARLLPFPNTALQAAARIVGMNQQFRQLCGTLRVNAAKAREHLGWAPKLNAREALTETARWYARSRGQS